MNKLSICVITMNRASQLCEALKSCLNCTLPDDTVFIIVDNGSTDNTEFVINDLLSKSKYNYIYKKLPHNIGVGPGRNICFNLANSEYSYYLDDDAIIDPICYQTFFTLALSLFESHKQVASITTTIKDPATDRNPIVAKTWKIDQYPCILMYYGGSHFLRNSVFAERSALYDNIKYGSEELSPSLYAYDKGYCNIYMSNIDIIHCPKYNKWEHSSKSLMQLTAGYCRNQFYIKRSILPLAFIPVVYVAYKVRLIKYFKQFQLPRAVNISFPTITQKFRIKFSTCTKLWTQFGFKIF